MVDNSVEMTDLGFPVFPCSRQMASNLKGREIERKRRKEEVSLYSSKIVTLENQKISSPS